MKFVLGIFLFSTLVAIFPAHSSEGTRPHEDGRHSQESILCPFCHEPGVFNDVDWTVCPKDSTPHHRACFDEMGGCSVCILESGRPSRKTVSRLIVGLTSTDSNIKYRCALRILGFDPNSEAAQIAMTEALSMDPATGLTALAKVQKISPGLEAKLVGLIPYAQNFHQQIFSILKTYFSAEKPGKPLHETILLAAISNTTLFDHGWSYFFTIPSLLELRSEAIKAKFLEYIRSSASSRPIEFFAASRVLFSDPKMKWMDAEINGTLITALLASTQLQREGRVLELATLLGNPTKLEHFSAALAYLTRCFGEPYNFWEGNGGGPAQAVEKAWAQIAARDYDDEAMEALAKWTVDTLDLLLPRGTVARTIHNGTIAGFASSSPPSSLNDGRHRNIAILVRDSWSKLLVTSFSLLLKLEHESPLGLLAAMEVFESNSHEPSPKAAAVLLISQLEQEYFQLKGTLHEDTLSNLMIFIDDAETKMLLIKVLIDAKLFSDRLAHQAVRAGLLFKDHTKLELLAAWYLARWKATLTKDTPIEGTTTFKEILAKQNEPWIQMVAKKLSLDLTPNPSEPCEVALPDPIPSPPPKGLWPWIKSWLKSSS